MRIILYTISGVIGTVLATLFFNALFGFQLQSFCLWFFIPVGGIYVGLGSVSGLYYYLLKRTHHFSLRRIEYKIYLVSFILGLATMFSLYYASYLIDSGASDISFMRYLEVTIISGQTFLAVNNTPSTQGIEAGGTINLIYFCLQIVGLLIGSLWPVSLKVLFSFDNQ